jgi:hypothetical protein
MGNGYAEAPASWTIRYRTPEGFDATLTLRGETGAELLPKTETAIKWLLEHDCTPERGRGEAPTGGHGSDDKANEARSNDPSWCPIHQVAMTKRTRSGDSWYSHKLPDGSWCRGK